MHGRELCIRQKKVSDSVGGWLVGLLGALTSTRAAADADDDVDCVSTANFRSSGEHLIEL